jgi:hypothetical protein
VALVDAFRRGEVALAMVELVALLDIGVHLAIVVSAPADASLAAALVYVRHRQAGLVVGITSAVVEEGEKPLDHIGRGIAGELKLVLAPRPCRK